MALLFNGLLAVLLLLYPLAVYFGLQYWNTRTIAVGLIAALSLRALITLRHKGNPIGTNSKWLVLIAICLLLLVFAFDDIIYFKFYPLVVNLSLLLVFALTLFNPPSMVERLARLQDPDLPDQAIGYTRRVTQLWCLFFIANACISFFTACCAPLDIWTLYNGLISYLLIGLFFVVEWLVRQVVQGKR